MKASQKISHILSRYMNGITRIEHCEDDMNYLCVYGDVDTFRIYNEVDMEDTPIIFNYDCSIDPNVLKIDTNNISIKTITKIMEAFDFKIEGESGGVHKKTIYTKN